MKVEQDTPVSRPLVAQAKRREAPRASADWTGSPAARAALDLLNNGAPRLVARAPCRLDVIGGLSDYAGASVLFTPLEGHDCVAVQLRNDGQLSIVSSERDSKTPTIIALSDLGEGGHPISAERAGDLLSGDQDRTVRCVVGVVVEMLRAGMMPDLGDGLSIAVAASPDSGPTTREQDASVAAATLVSTAAALDISLDPMASAGVCQTVQNQWLDSPVGISEALCALLGKPGTLSNMRCAPLSQTDSLHLPDSTALIAMDCGVIHPDAAQKYKLVRTAAFMGRSLIDRIVRHDQLKEVAWKGHLSDVTIDDYVGKFRDRIPTKMKGGEFLKRFGDTDDALTRIDPNVLYKIRSRTEHHIYEHWRAQQFFEFLRRAVHDGDDGALMEAGELMYASHWSYGQRCGLGSIETDLLVNLIRRQGEADVFGAKVTGRGCGGVVAVLTRGTDRADAALEAAAEKYSNQTGLSVRFYRGSTPGALITGAARV